MFYRLKTFKHPISAITGEHYSKNNYKMFNCRPLIRGKALTVALKMLNIKNNNIALTVKAPNILKPTEQLIYMHLSVIAIKYSPARKVLINYKISSILTSHKTKLPFQILISAV